MRGSTARRVVIAAAARRVVIAAAVGVSFARGGGPGEARAEEDDLEVPGLAAADLRGDALVWEDAPIYLEPWEGGANVRFGRFGRGRAEEVGRAIPVRIVASTMRSFVEIELATVEDCALRRVGGDRRVAALRLFVKRDDLAPVLVKPFAISYGDGTGVRLATGVPVVPTGGGTYMFALRGDRIRLPIPHASVGYIYSRGKVTAPAPATGPVSRIDRMAPVRLGGDLLELRNAWFVPRPAQAADSHLVKLTGRCSELTATVPATGLRPSAPPSWYRPSEPSSSEAKLVHHVLRGTPLATPSGREAAVAAEVIEVPAPAGDAPACFEARFTMYRLDEPPLGPQQQTTRLCAAARHVEGPAPSAQKAAPTPTGPPDSPPDVDQPPKEAQRTARGVWYRVLAPGKGSRRPRPTDRIKVHYTGWTTDGRMFDSSHTRGAPTTFPLSGLIPGWVDGLQIMTIGMKARFWIPEELAYKGSPGKPAGMLVFDVELIEIL